MRRVLLLLVPVAVHAQASHPGLPVDPGTAQLAVIAGVLVAAISGFFSAVTAGLQAAGKVPGATTPLCRFSPPHPEKLEEVHRATHYQDEDGTHRPALGRRLREQISETHLAVRGLADGQARGLSIMERQTTILEDLRQAVLDAQRQESEERDEAMRLVVGDDQ